MELNDTELISEYLKGNEDSFRIVVERYLKPIYRLAYRLTGNKNDSEDIVQAVFVKVWKNIKKYDASRSFKAWIFTIARNTIYDELRKRKEVVFSELEKEEDDNFFDDTESDEMSPEQIFLNSESEEASRIAISKLSKKMQEVIILKYDNDLTFEELSNVLGEPLNTVKSRYRRAVIKLKTILNAPK